ncbi:lactonase family protein [Sorangium sp. So ce726]|uniref:lactonase family protein n=1 Tax=Sorangium sp. So ce726 TaxID=3133319 RepID=UPI003F5E82A2
MARSMQLVFLCLAAGLWLGCGRSGAGATNNGANSAATGVSSGGGDGTSQGTGASGGGASGSGASGSGASGGGGGAGGSGAGGGGSQAERAFAVYVGGHQGLFVFRLDDADGALSAVQGPLDVEMNPTFLAVDPAHQRLFAANELNEVDGELSGAVSAFRIDPQGGTLELINRASSKGAGPAHLSTDRSGRFVLVANYGGGTAAVLPVGQDGALGQAVDDVSFGRRTRPHHAMTDPANRFAFVTNLGLDEIAQLTFDADTGQMEPNDPPALSLPADTTPRHLEFHPNGRFAYVINESAGSITTLSYDPSRGTFTALATVSTLPDGASAEGNFSAEVQVSPSGKFVYGSNRGHDSIAIFAVDPERGTLTPAGHASTQGMTPRHFQISPTGKLMLVANQDSSNIVAFHVDEATGALEPTGRVTEVPEPTYVGIVALPDR